jgi:two-component system sensor histidine kinase PilS (NtrC family)
MPILSSLDEKRVFTNFERIQQVQTLIIGRLIVIFLLLVTSWIWYSGGFVISFDTFPQGPLLVFIVSIGLTTVYFLLSRLSKRVMWQIRAQFLIDSFLITWLVWKTGDLTSPYITLYIVLIGVCSVYLRTRQTLLMTLICVIFFVLLSVLTATAVIETTGTEHAVSRVIQITSFHVVAFLVVGLLASRLSDRRTSGEQLKQAAKSLANLRALHERIVESIRSGLITTDMEGRIYTFNSAASEITGFSAEEMRGKTIFSLFGDIRQPIELSLQAVNEGEQQPRFEADLVTPEGFAVRIGFGVSELFSEENEVTGLIITFQDLTEIRSMEESVRRKDRLAAVGRVGAGLAHEIRNPLGAMRGAIQVLESNTPPESIQADLMNIILRESDRLSNIITNFLSYARPKVGDHSESDIREAIKDTLTLLSHSPDVRKDHVLASDLPPTPLFITADISQLKQVFWNLARNSIQAMPEGGRLRVAVEAVPNNRIKIVFEDTGSGMSPEQVEQLFEPFSNSTSGGTGLGLSIVYQIIRDHGGTINVRSIEEEGTRITIELPRESKIPAAPPKDADEPSPPSLLENYLNVKTDESEITS